MPRVKYQTDLPSIHLEEDDLTDIEQVFRDGETDSVIEFKLHNGPFTYEYSTTKGILSDNTLPDFVKSFELTLESKKGKVKITANEEDHDIILWISGERDWVKRKKDHIEDFFEHRGDHIRTTLQNHLPTIAASISIAIAIISNYSGFGSISGDGLFTDALLLGFGGLISGGILTSVINYFHPYSLIRLSNRQLHPYLWKVISWITIVAAIITILGVVSRVFPI